MNEGIMKNVEAIYIYILLHAKGRNISHIIPRRVIHRGGRKERKKEKNEKCDANDRQLMRSDIKQRLSYVPLPPNVATT